MERNCGKPWGRKLADYTLNLVEQSTSGPGNPKLCRANDILLKARLSIGKGGRIRLSGYVSMRSYMFGVASSGPDMLRKQRWQAERKVIYPIEVICSPKSI